MDSPAITFHLTPIAVWKAQQENEHYLPEAFKADRFIHCTDGESLVIEVGNRYYTSDARDYCLLSIAKDHLEANVVYEDPANLYPHIYGPLNTDAVVAVRAVLRSDVGAFLAIGKSVNVDTD